MLTFPASLYENLIFAFPSVTVSFDFSATLIAAAFEPNIYSPVWPFVAIIETGDDGLLSLSAPTAVTL